MLYRKIDKDGYFVEDIILHEPPMIEVESKDLDGKPITIKQPDPQYIAQKPEGLYKPRYVDGQWVEGLSESEIQDLQKPQRLAEIQSRLKELDIKTMKFVDGDITAEQYEPYRLEKQSLREEYRSLEG
jgi:hypothetical protein